MPSIDLEQMMLVTRKINVSKGIVVGVIGCGGTGSLFVRDAMRVLTVFNEQQKADGGKGILRTFFCDADIVEDKNLIRQNFIQPDVGRNKAEVLAERYGSAFNMDIEVIQEYIEDEEALFDTIFDCRAFSAAYYGNRPTTILFSMVDNVKTRLMISNFLHGYTGSRQDPVNLSNDVIVVDCGNSEYAGQVCVSSNQMDTNRFRLPTVSELQPDILDPANWDKFASELSCEDSAESDPQTISANATAANIAVNTLYNLLYKKGINYNKVVFNAQNNSTTTNFLRRNNYIFPAYYGGRINYEPAKKIVEEEKVEEKVEEKEKNLVSAIDDRTLEALRASAGYAVQEPVVEAAVPVVGRLVQRPVIVPVIDIQEAIETVEEVEEEVNHEEDIPVFVPIEHTETQAEDISIDDLPRIFG